MIKTILKKSLFLLALAIALTGCTDSISSSGYGRQLSPEEKLAYDNYCIYFSSDSAVTLKTNNELNYWNGKVEYSTDLENWSVWIGTEISSGTDNKIYLRGTGNEYITGNYTDRYFILKSDNNISCYGNIMTLLDYEKVKNNEKPEMAYACFYYLFLNNDKLITAPALPATTLARNCYCNMFNGCTSLKTAPALPATTLADSCYDCMFFSCTSLTTAPALPATTLADSCYNCMFFSCSSLTTAPALPATTLADSCYNHMFANCTSLTTAPALSSTTLADYCYSNMFLYCSSLTAAPALPAKTLINHCYHTMFYGCTSLTTVPEISATTLADGCCYGMFSGCTNIKVYETKTDDKKEYYDWKAPENPDDYQDCYINMFTQTGGEFTGTPAAGTTYYILRPAAEE